MKHHITEIEKLIIQTIAGYVLMNELAQNKIIPKEMWIKYVDDLSEIQKEIVMIYEGEKVNLMKKFNKMSIPGISAG